MMYCSFTAIFAEEDELLLSVALVAFLVFIRRLLLRIVSVVPVFVVREVDDHAAPYEGQGQC